MKLEETLEKISQLPIGDVMTSGFELIRNFHGIFFEQTLIFPKIVVALPFGKTTNFDLKHLTKFRLLDVTLSEVTR